MEAITGKGGMEGETWVRQGDTTVVIALPIIPLKRDHACYVTVTIPNI